MKRLFLSAFMFLCTYIVYAQSSICGVLFGETYTESKRILEDKWGRPSLEYNNEIWYFDRTYANLYFKSICFTFQYDGYRYYMNRCSMGRFFNTYSLACTFRDNIISKLKEKYSDVETYTDKNHYLAAHGGTSPTNSNEYGFSVFIVHDSYEGLYYVYLDYGPYDYVHEEL